MKTQITAGKQEGHADIVGTLVEVDKGRFIISAARDFTELLEAIDLCKKKKGKITITLDVSPTGWTEDGSVMQVHVDADVKITKPKPDRNKTAFFLTEEMNLQRNDPAQEKMFEK